MIHIREARRDDARGIATVHVASWRTTYRGIVPDAFLAQLSVEQRTQRWMETLAAGVESIYVAEEGSTGGGKGTGGGHIVGFASGGAQRDSDIPDYDGELYAVYILQEYQGHGVGRRLLRAVAEDLAKRGYNALLVWVLADNSSRAFYERLGGQFVREKPITIGGAALSEVAYGWPEIHTLL